MNTFISGEDGTVSYPARWTARGGPARWTVSATSWGGRVLGAEAAWSRGAAAGPLSGLRAGAPR